MRKPLAAGAVSLALLLAGATAADAQETDPNDVPAVDNPVDENDDGGFDDWGLLGLLGLGGLAGLAGRKRDDRTRTTTTGTGSTSIR